MLSWILAACIPVAAVVLRLLAGDDEPDNALVQHQENQPRLDPGADEPGPALAAA